MSKEEKRFESVYTQGKMKVFDVIVDKETGVNYLFITFGNAAGLTVLVDSEGKPVKTTVVS
ncbi:MAG: xylan 1,4-beta-xylosidase [Fastidiosipila sp.]|nr:xylan 1,4-beta-xylosidase [Fastidiosipila sp.]